MLPEQGGYQPVARIESDYIEFYKYVNSSKTLLSLFFILTINFHLQNSSRTQTPIKALTKIYTANVKVCITEVYLFLLLCTVSGMHIKTTNIPYNNKSHIAVGQVRPINDMKGLKCKIIAFHTIKRYTEKVCAFKHFYANFSRMDNVCINTIDIIPTWLEILRLSKGSMIIKCDIFLQV